MAAVLEWRLTGGNANTDPNNSLGGIMSATAISSNNTLNNLFDNVSASEASAGDTEYRAVDLYNSGNQSATSVTVWFQNQTSSSDTSAEMGQENASNPHTVGANLQNTGNEQTAPSSPAVTFSAANNTTPLSLSDIPAGNAARIWIKRIVGANAVNTSNDAMTLRAQYA